MSLTESEQHTLLMVARASIQRGLKIGKALSVNLLEYSPDLTEVRACFVTLEHNQQLRGCIGSLQAVRPLIADVCANAFAAAFRDRRFPPVSEAEFLDLDLHISILSKPEPMRFVSEADLLTQLRPYQDGLIIQDHGSSATFLPSVWESLPSPVLFLQHLKQKAGLPAGYWSNSITVSRYTTESIA